MLLTIAVAVGAWVLLGVWSGAASASAYEAMPCQVLGTAQAPGIVAVDHVPVELSPEGLPLAPSGCTAALAPAAPPAPDPAELGPGTLPSPDPAVLPEPDPAVLVPEPEPVLVPEPDPVVRPAPDLDAGDPAPSTPGYAPVPADPLDVPDGDAGETPDAAVPPPSRDGAGTSAGTSSTDPATTPADALPVGAGPPVVDPAVTDVLAVDPVVVDPLADPAAAVVGPLPVPPTTADLGLVEVPAAPDPDVGPVATTDIGSTPLGEAWSGGSATVRGTSATTGGTSALAPARGSSAPTEITDADAPTVPVSPPAPVPLPAPVPTLPPTPSAPAGPAGPAGPVGSPAASSGTSCYGAGQTDDADSVDAVLSAQITASLAQAAQRPTSGFAGGVVGGADDPGVRPG